MEQNTRHARSLGMTAAWRHEIRHVALKIVECAAETYSETKRNWLDFSNGRGQFVAGLNIHFIRHRDTGNAHIRLQGNGILNGLWLSRLRVLSAQGKDRDLRHFHRVNDDRRLRGTVRDQSWNLRRLAQLACALVMPLADVSQNDRGPPR